ncbi:MAG: S8 family serine peptidase [Patescibacteria group bacterium]|nr:S8 family serine peptidase [Patescibacteria group bacterium]
MKPICQNILIALLIVVPSTVILTISALQKNDATKIPASLFDLNTKYQVTAAESLDGEKIDPYGSRIFKASLAPIISTGGQTQRLIIKLKDTENVNNDDPGRDNPRIVSKLKNIIALEVHTNDDINKIAQEYEKVPAIAYAEPDYSVEIAEAEDEENNVSNGLLPIASITVGRDNPRIVPTTIVPTGITAKKIIIAIIDSGADIQHHDLQARIEPGWNTLDNNNDVSDLEGHGTHVAGILLKHSETASIMPIKFTNGKDGTILTLVRAIKYAADHNANVLNLSLGLPQESSLLHEAIRYAEDKGAIVIAAAGNAGKEEKYYPAAWPEVISVSALDPKGKRFILSNFGDWIDFSALGQDIYSAAPQNKYAYRSGTSQATPIVAGVTADLINTMHNSSLKLNLENIISLLQKQLSEPAIDVKVGRRIIDDLTVQEKILARIRAGAVVSVSNQDVGNVKAVHAILNNEIKSATIDRRVRYRTMVK